MKQLIASVLLLSSVSASAADFFIEGHAGALLGYGAEAGMDFGAVRVRGQFNQLDYDRTEELDGEEYDLTLELDSTGVLVDVHPFNGAFHMTAGLYDNGNGVSAKSKGAVQIGGSTVPAASVSTDFDGTAPYVGIGWLFGRSNKGLTGHLELGAMGNGDPNVTIVAPGASPADIAQEEQNMEDDLDEYGFLPVIKLGVGYYF